MLIEGDGQTSEALEGANTETSPASDATQNTQTSPATGANTGSESVPFHKNPEFQSYLDRQKKSWERDAQAKFSGESQKMKGEYDAKFRELEHKMQATSGSMSEENRSQLRALSKLINSDPEARKELGLDGIQELRDKLSKYEQGTTLSTFNSELGETAKTYADKYGFDVKDVEQDILEYVQNDPLWSQMGMSKGVVKKAARDYFSERSEELAERAANQKLVNEQKNKGRVSSQKPGGGATQTPPEPKSFREAINQSAQRHGVKI